MHILLFKKKIQHGARDGEGMGCVPRRESDPLYKFYTLARFSVLLNVNITIIYPNTQTLTVYM